MYLCISVSMYLCIYVCTYRIYPWYPHFSWCTSCDITFSNPGILWSIDRHRRNRSCLVQHVRGRGPGGGFFTAGEQRGEVKDVLFHLGQQLLYVRPPGLTKSRQVGEHRAPITSNNYGSWALTSIVTGLYKPTNITGGGPDCSNDSNDRVFI